MAEGEITERSELDHGKAPSLGDSLVISCVDANNVEIAQISGDTDEAFTLDTFAQITAQYHAKEKCFIIARTTTRDKENPTVTYDNFYSAPHLNKLLFRTGEDGELLHRYLRRNPVVATNPLTGQEIIGEVSYYRLDVLGALGRCDVTWPEGHEQGDPMRQPGQVGSRESLRSAGAGGAGPSTSQAAGGAGGFGSGRDLESGMPAPGGRRPVLLPPIRGSLPPLDPDVGPGSIGGGGRGGEGGGVELGSPLPALDTLEGLPLITGHARAVFIGTDYSYVHSPALRETFTEHALDGQMAEFDKMEAQRSTAAETAQAAETLLQALVRWAPQLTAVHESMARDGGGLGGVGGVGARGINLQTRMRQAINVPYSRAVVFGSMGSLYVLTSFLIFSVALMHIISNEATARQDDWYWSFLPFFSGITDRVISALFRTCERRLVVVGKFLLWTFYVLFPTVIYPSKLARDVLDLVFPFVFLAYSCSYYLHLASHKRLV